MDSTQESGYEHRLLSKEQVEQIHICTLDLLEQTGVWVQSEEALGILENAGCDIGDPKRLRYRDI